MSFNVLLSFTLSIPMLAQSIILSDTLTAIPPGTYPIGPLPNDSHFRVRLGMVTASPSGISLAGSGVDGILESSLGTLTSGTPYSLSFILTGGTSISDSVAAIGPPACSDPSSCSKIWQIDGIQPGQTEIEAGLTFTPKSTRDYTLQFAGQGGGAIISSVTVTGPTQAQACCLEETFIGTLLPGATTYTIQLLHTPNPLHPYIRWWWSYTPGHTCIDFYGLCYRSFGLPFSGVPVIPTGQTATIPLPPAATSGDTITVEYQSQ